jgi:hypothetical protein
MRTMMAKVAVAAAVAVGEVHLAGAGLVPAGACSLAGPMLEVPDTVDAGGTLVISGVGMASIEGDVGADCGGGWSYVSLGSVEIVVTFTTASGPKTVTIEAEVADGEDYEDFTIGPLEIDVPEDATGATITSAGVGAGEYSVVVLGGPTTTTTTAPAPPVAPAPPAAPREAQPDYTG